VLRRRGEAGEANPFLRENRRKRKGVLLLPFFPLYAGSGCFSPKPVPFGEGVAALLPPPGDGRGKGKGRGVEISSLPVPSPKGK